MDQKSELLKIKEEIVDQERYLSTELENLVYQKRRIKQAFQTPPEIKKRMESVIDNLKFRIIQVLHDLSDLRISLPKRKLEEVKAAQIDIREHFESTVQQIKRLYNVLVEEEIPRYAATTVAHEHRKYQTSSAKKKKNQSEEKNNKSNSFVEKNNTQSEEHQFSIKKQSKHNQKQKEIQFLKEFQEVKQYILQLKDRASEHKHQDYEVEFDLLHNEYNKLKQGHRDLQQGNTQVWESVHELKARIEKLEQENEKLVDILGKLVKQKVET